MDPFTTQLIELCAAHPTRAKWVFVPTHAVGRTLGELDLHTHTGATVLALVRDRASIPRPGPEVALAVGDTLALIGSNEALEAAKARLEGSQSR